jgi:hypothetical protein
MVCNGYRILIVNGGTKIQTLSWVVLGYREVFP